MVKVGHQHERVMDNALHQGGTHPCLHKLAMKHPKPHDSVTALVDAKFKKVNTNTTREELVQRWTRKNDPFLWTNGAPWTGCLCWRTRATHDRRTVFSDEQMPDLGGS